MKAMSVATACLKAAAAAGVHALGLACSPVSSNSATDCTKSSTYCPSIALALSPALTLTT